MSKLQIILIIVCIVGFLAGVFIFAGIIPVGTSSTTTATGNVVLWGTIKKDLIENTIDEFNRTNKTYRVVYVQKDANALDRDLTEALASGTGPDLFFLPENLIIRHADKVLPIPYATLPEKDFRDTFISESELFLSKDGILGLPFTIDPMVMYYNRDLLEGAGVVNPPEYWSDFSDLVKKVTVLGQSKNILKSAVAFGEFSNVANAKDIISAILIQNGNSIVARTSFGDVAGFSSTLAYSSSGQTNTSESILTFYTDFSNPIKDAYSWNRSLPYSRDAFISGDLATYFGFASELLDIQSRNPNLNYDVAKFPQTKDGRIKATFGRMNALAMAKTSKNLPTAYTAAVAMTSADFIGKLSAITGLPPVRRDLLAIRQVSPYYMQTFYDSALIARSWFDPSDVETDNIWRTMIEDISSGRSLAGQSAQRAAGVLDGLLK